MASILWVPVIFAAASFYLYIVSCNLPEIDYTGTDLSSNDLRFPRNLEDLNSLAALLQLYNTNHVSYVLLLFCSAYLYKQTFAIPGSVFMSLRDRSRMTMLKPTKMPTLTPAERAKIYREKIKKDSLKMAQYKKKERDRKQIARLKRTEEQIKKEREQSRIRQQNLTSCDDHSSTFEIQTTDFANILHLLDQNTEVEPDVSGVDLVDMEPYSVDQEPTSFDLMPVLMDMEPLSLDQEPLSLGQEPLSLEQEPLSLDQDQEPLSLDQEPQSLDKDQGSLSLDQEPHSLDQDQEPLSLGQEPLSLGQEPLSLDQEPLSLDQDQEPLSLDQEPLSLDKDQEPLSLDQQSHYLDQDHEPLSLDQEPHSLDQEPHSLDQEPHSLDHGPTEKEPPKSYPEGSYIRVKHGAEVYPAVNLLAGALFSVWQAFPLVCLLSASGATCCYLISKACGKWYLLKYFPDRVKFMQKKVEDNMDSLLFFLLFLRFFPMSPNWFLNMASPIINVPIHLFFLSVFIGLMPYNFICVQTGAMLSDIKSVDDIFTAWTLFQLAAIALVALVPGLLMKKLKQGRLKIDHQHSR